jgi:hypothetical protein
MRIRLLIRLFDYFFLIITAVLLALGSIGVFSEAFLFLGVVNAVIALGYKLSMNGKIGFPKNYFLYIVFLLTLLVHTYFAEGKFLFFWIFFSGGLLWLEVYNLKKIFSQYFTSMLIILGVLMGILYFYSLRNPIVLPNLVSLFAGTTNLIKHSNIGDLWAIVLIPILYKLIKNKSKIYIPLLLLGIYFLVVSYSRTAIVSLSVGIVCLFKNDIFKSEYRKASGILFVGIVILFIYFGLSKTTLLSRPYFLQAIMGLFKYPLGTGMGNFNLISHDSNLVHNIFLEILSGMGIFSIFFFAWIYKVLKRITISKQVDNVMVAIFLATLTDFCFNTTYTIPGFMWIWFVVLGLI